MKNLLYSTVAAAAFAVVATSASAQINFSTIPAFANDPSDFPRPQAGGTAGVNHAHVIAGVDVDEDGAEEIIYFRVDGNNSSSGEPDDCVLAIYEYNGTDNGYDLIYTDTIAFEDEQIGNFNQYGDIRVADLDGADGPEIIIWLAGPFGSAITENLFVYTSTADNTFGSGATAADDEYSYSTLLFGAEYDDCQSMDIGDVDGDGTLELILVDDNGDVAPTDVNSIGVASLASGSFEAGTATFSVEALDVNFPQAGGSIHDAVLADMNNDGQLDIVGGHYNNGGMSVFEATAADTYSTVTVDASPGPADYDVLYKSNAMVAADFDADGATTVFGLSSSEANIYTLTGVSSGPVSSVTPTVTLAFDNETDLGVVQTGTQSNGDGMAGHWLTITDIDADGSPELVAALTRDNDNSDPIIGSASEVVIFEYNSGAENLSASYTTYDGTVNGVTSSDIIMGVTAGDAAGILDMDGDGIAELVIATSGETTADITVYELAPANVNEWSTFE